MSPLRHHLVLLIAIFALSLSGPSMAASLVLSAEEQAFVRQHPVIRIGVDPAYAPYAFIDNDGQYRGLSADIMALVSERTGLIFEVVPNLSWPEILQAAQRRELDLITTTALRPEREAYLNFTRIYIKSPLVTVTRIEHPRIDSASEFEQTSIALVTGYNASAEVMARYPKVKPLMVDTMLQGLTAVSTGKVDAFVGVLGVSNHLIHQHGLSNLEVNAGFDMQHNGQRLAIRKDWPVLAQLMDRTLASLDRKQMQALLDKWLPVNYEQLAQIPAGISAAQQQWLDQHPTVRVGVLSGSAPYETFSSDRQHGGLASAYLGKLKQFTGQTFEFHEADSQEALLAMLRSGSIDLISAWYKQSTPEDLRSSQDYLSSPLLVIATRPNPAGAGQLDNQRIAVIRESFTSLWLASNSQSSTVAHNNAQGVLDSLLDNDSDLAVLPAAIALPLLQQARYEQLKVTATLPNDLRLRMLVRSDWPQQQALIDLMLRNTSESDHVSLRNTWLMPPTQYGLDPNRVLSWALAAFLLAALGYTLIVTWNYRLKTKLAQQREAQQMLLEGREKTLELMILEVEQRELAQQALRNNERLLRRAQTVAGVGSWVWQTDNPALDISEEAARILNWPHANPLTFERLCEHLHPEDRRRFELDWQACLNGHEMDGEYRLLINNQSHWVGVCAEREGQNAHTKVVATLHDLHEMRCQQAEYNRLHQQMDALIEGSIDCIFVKDEQGHYLVANRALCELVNLSPEQLIGKLDSDLFPADLAEQYREDDQRFMQLQHACTYEEQVQTANGRRAFLTTKGPLIVDGQVRGVFGISREISELKKAEEKIRLLNTTLENRVAQRTAELEQVNQELRSFSYSVSHDLKAPLRAIQGYSQLLLEDHNASLNPEGQHFLITISQSAGQMATLIDNLLDYSRTERQALQSEPVHLEHLCQTIIDLHRQQLDELNAEVSLQLHDITLQSDARCLQQILGNLIDNAIKFRHPELPPVIEVSARLDSQYCTLRVHDNGVGFEMKYQTRIFDIFQRLHSQTEYPGTGIGLAIVRKAAQRLNAQVWADSKPGLGSSFYVRIPRYDRDQPQHLAD
ncbi:transporter substrate-binding domain-containing protein [Atopomonas sediminilitoris]|uniref:transporter substrate-binding domain-containing protein n=1 Tax=Atopomonas sediminilitoris TaxID=2919919 RepID=UPI001F4E04DB|nr:transporter substrate-binding domain-containing protein [Atopomonas sediminilitoris]MCJ8168945.1 transporter substrate-binding domain-containing protein [Atopomonas sediminilitoris]